MIQKQYVEIIADLAKENPDRIAIYVGKNSISMAQLEARSNQLARVYQSYAVELDDIVTLALPNSIELMVATLACWKVGARPNPISTSMPIPELKSFLKNAQPKLIIRDGGENIGIPSLPADYIPDSSVSDAALPIFPTPAGERALASGGSTGTPKLIIPVGRAVFNPAGLLSVFTIKRATVVPGPLYHALPFSETWQAVLRGAVVVVMPRFDAEEFLALIEEHRADHLFIVPTMMLRIWRLPEKVRLQYDLSSVETVISGGGPLSPWLMQNWIDWLGADVMNEGFGPSERIGGTFITGKEWLKHPGSVGRPLPFCKLKILDDDGSECPPGRMGQIYFLPEGGAGSTYFYMGAVSERREGGWETVGDMGYLDEAGYLYLGDRRSDMILINSRNIYPAEIEGAIERFPEVRSCAVIGMPGEQEEQIVYAIVDCLPGSIDEKVLRDFLINQITAYKIPTKFEFVSELLRNDAGKVRRGALQEARTKNSCM